MPKYLCSIFLALLSSASLAIDENDSSLPAIAQRYDVPVGVLQDFVASYNFKCPAELSEAQMIWLLKDAPYDNELRVMAESEGMEYRDIYVETRSHIQCLSKGEVSKAY